jgi:CheY-like chemotaxis protein
MATRWLMDARGADPGAVPHSSVNSVAPELNVIAGVGNAERNSLGPTHLPGGGKEASVETPETGTGRDNRLVEGPTNGVGGFSTFVPTFETLARPSLSAEALGHREGLRLGMRAFGSKTGSGQELVGLDGARGRDFAITLPSPGPDKELRGKASPLPAADSVLDLGLFQCDVAAARPMSSDAPMPGTGTTSMCVASDESSIWSILTTYALVIVPRQRKYQATILVVDPDDATRDALSVGLVRAGYFVLPAANVRDAWGVLRTPNARIDLVLMDPNLPDVSGIHLCARLREISPTLPVMVCAGEVEPAEAAQLQQLGVRYYLRKPIAFEELLHTVQAILH